MSFLFVFFALLALTFVVVKTLSRAEPSVVKVQLRLGEIRNVVRGPMPVEDVN